MATKTFNRTRNIDSPFGKNSIFYTHYFGSEELPEEDLGANASQYIYKVFVLESGTEVFEKYNDFVEGSIPANYLHVYIEKEDAKRSNLFGTACRVRMGADTKELLMSLNAAGSGATVTVYGDPVAKSLKEFAEDVTRFNSGKIKNSTPLYHALLIELMDQSQLNKMLNDALSVNNTLADYLNTGVELMDKWKFTEENYDYEKHFLNIRNTNPWNPNGYQPYTYKPIIPIPATMSYAESFRAADQNTFAATGVKKLSEFANHFEEISTAVIYNMAKATSTRLDDFLLAGAGFLKELVDEALPEQVKSVIKKLKAVYAQVLQAVSTLGNALKERVGMELARTNAFLCGLINGLISLGQTILMILAMVAGNIPLLEWEKLSPLEIAKHQETLEFVEDFVDLVAENASEVLTGITKLFSDSKVLKELSEFVQMLKRKFLSLNEFFWAYFVGGVLFEIILDAVIAYFTGGSSLVAQVSAKISRLTAKTNQLGAKAANFGKNLGQKVNSLGDLWKFLKKELDEFLKAVKSGDLINWLKKKFFEFTGDAEGLRKLYLSKWLKKFDKSLFAHIDGEAGMTIIEKGLFKSEYIEMGQGGHNANVLGKSIRRRPYTKFEPDPPIDDFPFKAEIDIKYRYEWLPKKQTSSMFPKNWNLERIKEEVAWVYENSVAKGVNKKIKSPTDLFDKYEGSTTSGFKIRLEIDESGNIMNAYPIIN